MQANFCLAVALAAAMTLPLGAQTEARVERGEMRREGRAWVQESECRAAVEPGAQLTVRLDRGSIRVETGEGDELECHVHLAYYTDSVVEARELFRRSRLTLRRVTGGGAYLGGQLGGETPRTMASHMRLQVRVPVRFNLDLETQSGNITVGSLQGELRAATAGGEIRTGDIRGPVRVETAGGNLSLGNVKRDLVARTAGGCIRAGDVGGNARLESSGGHIITGRIGGRARAETAGGDIVLRGAGADVNVQTAGGQIRIGETGGRLEAETAGGSIRLDAVEGPVMVETAGGSIELYRVESAVKAATAAGRIRAQIAATAGSFGESNLQTQVGDVEVYLPENLPLTIEAIIDAAAGHRIQTDFPLEIEGEEASYHPKKLRGWGALNGGGAVLRIHTVSGDIKILKLDPAELERLRRQQELHWERWREIHLQELERPRARQEHDEEK